MHWQYNIHLCRIKKGACVLSEHILSKASWWCCCCVRWIAAYRSVELISICTPQQTNISAWQHHPAVVIDIIINIIIIGTIFPALNSIGVLFSLQRAPVCATSQFSVAFTPTDDGLPSARQRGKATATTRRNNTNQPTISHCTTDFPLTEQHTQYSSQYSVQFSTDRACWRLTKFSCSAIIQNIPIRISRTHIN